MSPSILFIQKSNFLSIINYQYQSTEANAIIVKESDAGYWKIDISSTNGNVVLAGFIHDKKAETRIVAKIRQIKGVKSVKSNLKVEEKR